jgi:outer membrane protein OmpA-like peptidoglycan-associated protein
MCWPPSTRILMRFFALASLVCAFVFPVISLGQENSEVEDTPAKTDAGGCKDFPIFPKLPLSIITSCHSGDSMEVTMPLAPDAQGYQRNKVVHGAYEFREYQITREDQQEQAFNNLLMLLPISGFTVKYSSSPSTITARNEDIWLLISVNGEFYNVSAVKEAPWTPVRDEPGIEREMDAHSRVAIYGIAFSPDSQAVVEQRSRILGQVLKYLQENPNVAVVVESHKMTPNGSQESDQETTVRRAQAVVAWLEAHGIAAERLQSRPLGRSKPITENSTPLEVRQNDRIELVKPTPSGPEARNFR